MSSSPFRARRAVCLAVLVFAGAGAATSSAGTLGATLDDPPDAPAYVSACSLDIDSSGVFTPHVTVSDRKRSPLAGADVAFDFYDAADRKLGTVVASAPYGPAGLPFGSVDHVGCKVKSARFLDGTDYAAKMPLSPGAGILPIAGAVLGVGAAAAAIGASHGSSSGGGSAAAAAGPSPAPTFAAPTPAPVATVITLAKPRKRP